MKKVTINLILLISLLLHFGCEKVTLLPIQGDIQGLITDNNGQPVAGATVSATFEAPSDFGAAQEQIKSTTTDSDGYYHLTDLWDKVFLNIDHAGLESVATVVELKNMERTPQVDLMMNGSPTVKGVTFDKTTLSINSIPTDSILFDLEVADVYNNQLGIYQGNLLLQDNSGNIRKVIPATIIEQGLETVLLSGAITSEDLAAGMYQAIAEVSDPDGNTHWISTGESILLE